MYASEREMAIFSEGQQKYCVTRPKVFWTVVDDTADRTTCNAHIREREEEGADVTCKPIALFLILFLRSSFGSTSDA